MKIPKKIHDILTQNYFGYACTTDTKNNPHVTPMFFVYDPDEIKVYLIVGAESKKVKNLKSNPKISLTVDIRDPLDPFKNEGVLLQGKGDIKDLKSQNMIRESSPLKRISEMFIDKYKGVVESGESKEGEVLVEMNIKKIVHWKGPRFISIKL